MGQSFLTVTMRSILLLPLLLYIVRTDNCGFQEPCPTPDGRYPCPRDCSAYVQCSNGMPNVMQCPVTTFYNPDREKCSDYTCRQCEDRWELQCPGDSHQQTFLPDYEPGMCDWYWVCQYDVACHYKCPPGTHWGGNPALGHHGCTDRVTCGWKRTQRIEASHTREILTVIVTYIPIDFQPAK